MDQQIAVPAGQETGSAPSRVTSTSTSVAIGDRKPAASAEQSWDVYARSVLAFSAVSILFLYPFLRIQDKLWLSLGFAAVPTHIAWNTAVSFVTNTNWQAYSGESTMGHHWSS